MRTTSGSWAIYNTTRYNTADLTAVFDAYEEWAALNGSTCVPDRAKPDGTVKFTDYTPMRDSYRTTSLVNGKLESVDRQVFVRGPAVSVRHLRDVGLVKPARLYSNPLAALTAPRVSGEEVVPHEFIEQVLSDAVSRCYVVDPLPQEWWDNSLLNRLNVRINRHRGAAPGGVRFAPRLEKLKNLHMSTGWAVNRALAALEEVEKCVSAHQRRFDEVSIENELGTQDVAEALAVLEGLKKAYDADTAKINEVLE